MCPIQAQGSEKRNDTGQDGCKGKREPAGGFPVSSRRTTGGDRQTIAASSAKKQNCAEFAVFLIT
jgi:hypothetical protein